MASKTKSTPNGAETIETALHTGAEAVKEGDAEAQREVV